LPRRCIISADGQLKLAIDRTYALLKKGRPSNGPFSDIHAALSPEAAKSTLSMFRQLRVSGVVEAGYIIAPGSTSPADRSHYDCIRLGNGKGRMTREGAPASPLAIYFTLCYH
jgi:hypothetical protein